MKIQIKSSSPCCFSFSFNSKLLTSSYWFIYQHLFAIGILESLLSFHLLDSTLWILVLAFCLVSAFSFSFNSSLKKYSDMSICLWKMLKNLKDDVTVLLIAAWGMCLCVSVIFCMYSLKHASSSSRFCRHSLKVSFHICQLSRAQTLQPQADASDMLGVIHHFLWNINCSTCVIIFLFSILNFCVF